MLYSPRELSDELGVPNRTLRDWLDKGAPHAREGGHIWINGREFAAWVEASRRTKPVQPLADGEAYCLRCHKPVPISGPVQRRRGNRILLTGTCPNCGAIVNRGNRDG